MAAMAVATLTAAAVPSVAIIVAICVMALEVRTTVVLPKTMAVGMSMWAEMMVAGGIHGHRYKHARQRMPMVVFP